MCRCIGGGATLSSTEVRSSLQSVWDGGRGWTRGLISPDRSQPLIKVTALGQISCPTTDQLSFQAGASFWSALSVTRQSDLLNIYCNISVRAMGSRYGGLPIRRTVKWRTERTSERRRMKRTRWRRWRRRRPVFRKTFHSSFQSD